MSFCAALRHIQALATYTRRTGQILPRLLELLKLLEMFSLHSLPLLPPPPSLSLSLPVCVWLGSITSMMESIFFLQCVMYRSLLFSPWLHTIHLPILFASWLVGVEEVHSSVFFFFSPLHISRPCLVSFESSSRGKCTMI
ncbi:hypothetical protein GOP47_0006813 [Adiantum capillus-veneris]|uniref:Uncharacterized protein n=1 Tax=Adiantum capillus-veneris TaxID=13818 RepID=A0A9D4V4C1_ADICA|nr:hypothetical protein GOP47_0006813 [Adiantum capillus-veneris]